MKMFFFVTAMFFLGFTTAQAQYRSPHSKVDNHRYEEDRNNHRYEDRRNVDRNTAQIEQMQREARQRIDKGIQRRQISPREANRLMNDYKHIEVMQRKYSHRGRLSNKETRILSDQLTKLMATTRRMSDSRGHYRADDRRYRHGY